MLYLPRLRRGSFLVSIFLFWLSSVLIQGEGFAQKASGGDHSKTMSHDQNHNMKTERYKPADDSEGGDFTLMNQTGHTTSLHDFMGNTVLIFFGFTNCLHICSPALTYLNLAVNDLGEDAGQVKVLFITLDPDRDKPDVMKRYLEKINPEFIGLTGSYEQIKTAADKYGIRFAKGDVDKNGDYIVTHTTVINIVDRDGALVDTIPYNTPPEETKRIIRQHMGDSRASESRSVGDRRR